MKKSTVKLILILAAVLLVAELAFLGWNFLKGEEPQPTEAPTAAPTQGSTEVPTETPTEAPTEPPTEAPTEAPTEPPVLYRNPLNGAPLDAPLENRIIAVTINNQKQALPHRGVTHADIYMEMFVNGSLVRGLALYSDISAAESVGSVRSIRPIFGDIAKHFDMIIAHSGGSDHTLNYLSRAGVSHKNIGTSSETYYAYRDSERTSNGYAWEHILFVKGEGLRKHLADKDYRVTQEPDKTYGFHFVEDVVLTGGEDAPEIAITYTHRDMRKSTTMVYNEELGKYVYNQYNQEMRDADTDELEAFTNVIVMLGSNKQDAEGYHIFDFVTGGEGYYATGGKIIPIKWSSADKEAPFEFFTADGEQLNLNVGNTFIAVAPNGSPVEY